MSAAPTQRGDAQQVDTLEGITDLGGCQDVIDEFADPEDIDDTPDDKNAPRPGDLGGSATTDEANAKRFVAQHGTKLRYVKKWGTWLVWDGMRWAEEEVDLTRAMARETARRIYSEAMTATSDKEAEALAKWARASSSADRMEKMVRVASWDPAVMTRPKEFDREPWELNTPGGILDLKTGIVRAHAPSAMHTKLTATAVQEGNPIRWLRFLDEIFDGDRELMDWVQRLLGYSLMGTVREHVLAICWGSGANGKSTLLEVVQGVLGEYAAPADPTLLLAKRSDAHPAGIADLRGLRLVTCQETDEGRSLDEATVKNLTGGTERKARFMRGNFFSYTPSDTIWLATNHRPMIRNNDNGIWRRVKLIPFTVEIPVDRQNPELKAELLATEGPQILAWLVTGCLRYQAEGLGTAKAVETATERYRAEMDTIGEFIKDRCTVDGSAKVSASELFSEFTAWAQDNKVRLMDSRRFSHEMADRGFDEVRRRDGKVFLGIKVTPWDERLGITINDDNIGATAGDELDEILELPTRPVTYAA